MHTLVPKEGGHTLLNNTLCVIPPWSKKPPSFVGSPKGHTMRAVPMHRMVNKAHAYWVAANLISGHLIHTANHKHGTAGHSQGKNSAPQAADV